MKSITWKIGGEAGFGIMTTGLMFSRVASRHGYHIFDYVEYPSLIKGGHNVYEVRVSDRQVYAQEKKIDFLLALNRETVDRHKDQMKEGGIVVYDNEQYKVNLKEFPTDNILLYPLPFQRITKETGATPVMANNVVLGVSLALLSMDIDTLFSVIESIFGSKGEKVVNQNKHVAQAGFNYVKKNPPQGSCPSLSKRQEKPHLVLSGNEAVGIGAIAAGCKFFVAYPMTPSSSLLHFMAAHAKSWDLVVKHAEDEISVINMAIGASYTGVRTMLGTAGGGFSLMVEGLGLAAITETPLVILLAQRPGPATGMPTWTSQGDLHFVINASQDEFPRIVLTPGDISETFYLTTEAFNLADIYQTPVFILSDKYLAESHASVEVFDLSQVTIDRGKLMSWEKGDTVENYLRYKVTDDGIPERALPGMKKAVFTANSYEHDEYGWSTEEVLERVKQVNRRSKKLEVYKKSIPKQNIYGEENSNLTLIGWGSTKGPVLQALQELKEEGFDYKVNFLHIAHAWPFPTEQVKEVLSKAKKTLLIEGNSQAQMGGLIRTHTGIDIANKYLKYDGRPFYPEDIKVKIREVLS